MPEMQGHYGGSTGAGATRPAGLPLAADAALVAPAPVLPKTNISTEAGPNQVPHSDRSAYLGWSGVSTQAGPNEGPEGDEL